MKKYLIIIYNIIFKYFATKSKKVSPEKTFFLRLSHSEKIQAFFKSLKKCSIGGILKTFNRYLARKLLSSLSLTTYPYFNPYFPIFSPFQLNQSPISPQFSPLQPIPFAHFNHLPHFNSFQFNSLSNCTSFSLQHIIDPKL